MRPTFVVRALSFVVCFVAPSLAFAETAGSMGYGALLFQLVIVVVGVCALAYVILRFGMKRLLAPDRTDGPLEVVSRLPVEPRRSILLIRVGDRHLIVGSSEAGLHPLGEYDNFESETDESTPFATVLEDAKEAS